MAATRFTALSLFGFSLPSLFGEGGMLLRASDRPAAMNSLTAAKQALLTSRIFHWFSTGAAAARRFRIWLVGRGKQADSKFTAVDSLFSFVYGGAISVSLCWAWMTLERPFHPVWVVAPLAMMLIADWAENLIHLAQLRHDVSSDEGRLQYLWIKASCCATIIKLWLTLGLYGSLMGLVVKVMVTYSHRRLLVDAAH